MRIYLVKLLAVLSFSVACFGVEYPGDDFNCSNASDIFLSAKNDDPIGLYNAGVLYVKGWCVDRDPEVAYALFARSAKHGVLDAYYNVALMLHVGVGIDKNPEAAGKIFKELAGRGHQLTKNYLAEYKVKYKDKLIPLAVDVK